MRIYPKTWTVAIIGVAAFSALVMFGGRSRDLAAQAHSNTAVAVMKDVPAPAHTLIAPADVLGTGTPWAPLTGDGSN